MLAPGGHFTIGVWNGPEHNPWSTIPTMALVALGLIPEPDRSGPGMFALADSSRLDELLADAGFVERRIEAVTLNRSYPSIDAWIAESAEMSGGFGGTWAGLDEAQRRAVLEEIRRRAEPFTAADGSVLLPGSSLAAVAV